MYLQCVSRTAALAFLLPLWGCASFPHRDPLHVTVAGIKPQFQGLEMRMMVNLRVQNPNDSPVDYDGMAVEMNVQGKTFATGVSDATGSLPRFGETEVSVPVTISALDIIKQAKGLMGSLGKLHYEMKGKLNAPSLSDKHKRFAIKGELDLTNLKSMGKD